MLRRSDEDIRFNVQNIRSKRTRKHQVSLGLGDSVYYLSSYEAFALADRLVDIAERIDREA